MTLTLELPPELENRLKAEAARQGLPVVAVALRLLERHLSDTGDTPRSEPPSPSDRTPLPRAPTARELLALSPDERDRVLAAQAHDAAPLYAADLFRPTADRQVTALTALDGEPFCDDE